ncbi:hypothetical protein [Ornithinimicrobium cerasi]|uniref:hypothetical protein n=1 Tax=Ornithinimicrobium cerasi TaxID=2248773 RepID=UPI000F009133|nr:hypothetical protein [Ornithinimicrobium cerasi]
MSHISPDSATSTLQQMRDDRSRVAALTSTPWWAPTLLALVAGLWVASASMSDRTTGYVLALAGAALVVYLVRAQTGIKVRRSGPRQWSLGVLWLLFTLAMYSVSLALGSVDKAGWTVVPALAAGTVTYFVVTVSDRWARDGLRA